MTLRERIVELFEYRHIPQLLLLAEQDDQKRNLFLNKLIAIQEEIYHLDAVLESDWKILQRDLKMSWDNIYNALREIGVAEKDYNEYCKHIFKYQKHELSQRKGKTLLRFKMEYFYFYKSCDVKLIRRLVYDRYPSLKKIARLPEWRWFDLVTEVNDDIEDVYEDVGTNNGNRFLIGIQKHGLKFSSDTYIAFVEEVRNLFYEKHKVTPFDSIVFQLTTRAIEDTLNLLNQRISELKQNPVALSEESR